MIQTGRNSMGDTVRCQARARPWLLVLIVIVLLGVRPIMAEGPAALTGLDALYPSLDAPHIDLHKNPELSFHEEKTAAKLAMRLRAVGFEVTEKVGGHGIAGVLRNGAGPTVMVRTDMDTLPIKEQTGLSYASTVTARTHAGETVGVMHMWEATFRKTITVGPGC